MDVGICLATLFPRPRDPSRRDVAIAVEAAVAAGFTTASVSASLVDQVHGGGLQIRCVEGARSWSTGSPRAAAAEAERLATAAQAVGADQILAVVLDGAFAHPVTAHANFGGLVDAAACAGARVSLEFVPWSAVSDLISAWRFVEPYGPGAAVLVDAWHWVRQRGGPDLAVLRQVPGDRIGCVQLCDLPPAPDQVDVRTEALSSWRLLPGDGIVDFASIGAALGDAPAGRFYSLEVFNGPLIERLGPWRAAVAMMEAVERVAPSIARPAP